MTNPHGVIGGAIGRIIGLVVGLVAFSEVSNHVISMPNVHEHSPYFISSIQFVNDMLTPIGIILVLLIIFGAIKDTDLELPVKTEKQIEEQIQKESKLMKKADERYKENALYDVEDMFE